MSELLGSSVTATHIHHLHLSRLLKQYFGSITVLNVLIRDVRRKYMSDCLKNQILTYIFSYLEYVPPKSSM